MAAMRLRCDSTCGRLQVSSENSHGTRKKLWQLLTVADHAVPLNH